MRSTAHATSALKAGVPIEVPALTVNRLCGSGIQAAVSSAQLIQLDEADIVLTGGTENMSQAPHVMRGLRSGLRFGQGKLEDLSTKRCLDPYCGLFMAQTAEKCAAKYGSRATNRTLRAAQPAGWRRGVGRMPVQGGGVPVEIKRRKGVTVVDQRRSPAPGHDPRRPGQAAARVLQGWDGDGRQRQRHRRRRRGAGPRRRRRRSRAGLTPVGAWSRGRPSASIPRHGDGAGAGDAQGAMKARGSHWPISISSR